MPTIEKCAACKRRPARAGRSECQVCADKRSRREKSRKIARAKLGRCTACGKATRANGSAWCEPCQRRAKSWKSAWWPKNRPVPTQVQRCRRCGDVGHKATRCQNMVRP